MDIENKIDTKIEEVNGIKTDISASPIEIKADLTEVINNSYNDGFKPILKESGNALTFCLKFFESIIKPYMYKSIKEAEYKCMKIDKSLEEKYNNIPEKYRIEPRTCIVGPALDVLKYNLDEEHIKEIFINILTNEMDSRKQNKVIPAYINIVNQLTKQDAEFLKELYKISNIQVPIIKIRLGDYNGYIEISNYLIVINDKDYIPIDPIVLDNLLRLKILEIPYGIYITDKKNNCEAVFNKIKESPEMFVFNNYPNEKLTYTNEKLQFTDFGKNFIDICLS